MPDQFINAISRQLQSLSNRLYRTTNSSRQMIAREENNESDFAISPQQVLEIMQGNSQWMKQFEQNIERDFAALGDRIIERWLKTTDSEIRHSISELTELLNGFSPNEKNLDESLLQSISRSTSGLRRIISNAAGGLLEDLLTHTSHRRRESERSLQETERYRHSRGQTQAEISRELARGKRYL